MDVTRTSSNHSRRLIDSDVLSTAPTRSNALQRANKGASDRLSLDTKAANSEIESAARSYLDSGITSSHLNKSKSNKKLKSEALQIRYQTRKKIVKILTDLGEVKTADSMSLCGEKFAVLTCGEHIASKMPFHRCNIRYCPMCASRRAGKYVNKYLPYALDFVNLSPIKLTPCLLTLTQVKIKGEKLKDSRERILKSFHKYIRHSFFNEHFAGGLYAIENTVSDNGNHCHIHCVLIRKKFVSDRLLKEHWAMVSPGAKNLNIKRVESIESGLRECIKYISKPIPADKLQRSHIKEILELKGKRMIDTFGEFRNFCRTHELPEPPAPERPKLAEGQCCPNCINTGNLLFQMTLTMPDLIKFYRRIERNRLQMKC